MRKIQFLWSEAFAPPPLREEAGSIMRPECCDVCSTPTSTTLPASLPASQPIVFAIPNLRHQCHLKSTSSQLRTHPCHHRAPSVLRLIENWEVAKVCCRYAEMMWLTRSRDHWLNRIPWPVEMWELRQLIALEWTVQVPRSLFYWFRATNIFEKKMFSNLPFWGRGEDYFWPLSFKV